MTAYPRGVQSAPGVRTVPRRTLVAFVVVSALYVLLANAALSAGWLGRPSSPLISLNLVAGLAGFALLVGGGLFWLAGVRPADVGLRISRLPVATASVIGLWLMVQAVLLGIDLSSGEAPRVAASWLHPTAATVLIGALIGQVAGIALFEEVTWRGFVLQQLAAGWFWGARAQRWPAAALTSSAIFMIAHVPNRLLVAHVPVGELPFDLIRVFLGSLILAGVFIATSNLWYTIGLHALSNEPVPLVETSPDVAAIVTLGVGLMLAVGWWLVRARGRRDPPIGSSPPVPVVPSAASPWWPRNRRG